MRIHWSRLADNDFNVTIATVAALQDTKETDYQLYCILCEHLQLATWLGIMPYYRKTNHDCWQESQLLLEQVPLTILKKSFWLIKVKGKFTGFKILLDLETKW
jgi:hypothetical protein